MSKDIPLSKIVEEWQYIIDTAFYILPDDSLSAYDAFCVGVLQKTIILELKGIVYPQDSLTWKVLLSNERTDCTARNIINLVKGKVYGYQ